MAVLRPHHRCAAALALAGMVLLAGPASAASGRALLQAEQPEAPGAGGDAPRPPGQILIPGIHDDYGNLITAMLANQGDMIAELASSVIHPALANPLASLANMMTLVQTSLPDLLAGALPFEPNPLVHEMFVKYSNGTKTEADLAMLDKGLDELFAHEFTEGDKAKLADLLDVKEAFEKEDKPLPAKDIPLPDKEYKEWPELTPKHPVRIVKKQYKLQLPNKTRDELDDKLEEWSEKDDAHRAYVSDKVKALQKKLDAKVEPAKDLKNITKKAVPIARAFGKASAVKQGKVTYVYSFNKTNGETKVWNAIFNKTNLGGIKNQSFPSSKWKVINIPKKSQNSTLAKDKLIFNLTKEAFPTNKGKDPLEPLVDILTADPVGDHLANAMAPLVFRDPVLKGVARSATTVTSKGTTPAVKVYDRALVKEGKKFDPAATNKLSMNKVQLFNFGFSKYQYRPCIFSEAYTALSVGVELLRIRPEGVNIAFDGARISPQLIDIAPALIKVQAVGAQFNPELINVEPILISISPKINMVGKAVPKPWQLTKPPKFGPRPKEDFKTLPPYPKPHT